MPITTLGNNGLRRVVGMSSIPAPPGPWELVALNEGVQIVRHPMLLDFPNWIVLEGNEVLIVTQHPVTSGPSPELGIWSIVAESEGVNILSFPTLPDIPEWIFQSDETGVEIVQYPNAFSDEG